MFVKDLTEDIKTKLKENDDIAKTYLSKGLFTKITILSNFDIIFVMFSY